MSVGFLLKRKEDSVVWRGPKKNAMIRQFLSDVRWGELDYLVIDTPPGEHRALHYAACQFPLRRCSPCAPLPPPSELPRGISHRSLRCRLTSTSTGTSDEHLSLVEHMAPVHDRISAVIVTTPQAVALLDAMKCLSFTRATSLPVLGLVENMSGYVCPCCGEISNVFSTGGGAEMARREKLTFLGSLPVDTELVTLLDAAEVERPGESAELPEGGSRRSFGLLERYQKTPTAPLFKAIVDKILERLSSGAQEEG